MNKEIKFSNLTGLMPSITLYGGGAQYLRNNQKPIIKKVRELNKDLSNIGGIE